MKYPVAEIFFTIQGEGHLRGFQQTFIRLAGCSVRCPLRRDRGGAFRDFFCGQRFFSRVIRITFIHWSRLHEKFVVCCGVY